MPSYPNLASPVHAYWDLEPQYPHTCLNKGAIVFSASTINIFTDVLTTLLPMPLIWKLQMPARQRLAVMAIFGLGIIVDVAGAIRTYYVWESMIASYDETWKGWPVLLAATVEINLGLVRNLPCTITTKLRFIALRLRPCPPTPSQLLRPPPPRILLPLWLQPQIPLQGIAGLQTLLETQVPNRQLLIKTLKRLIPLQRPQKDAKRSPHGLPNRRNGNA